MDENGNSDCLSYPAEIDLSKMTLQINDPTKLNQANKYTIATLSGGIKAGTSFKSTNLTDGWEVRYYAGSHELKMVWPTGTMIILR